MILLIVIVILIIFYAYPAMFRKPASTSGGGQAIDSGGAGRAADTGAAISGGGPTAPTAGETATGAQQAGTDEVTKSNVESMTVNESVSFGENAAGACDEASLGLLYCPTACDATLAYAKDSYGMPGITFKEWIMIQSIDPAAIQNHRQFISDRMAHPEVWTGATYSPDRHDTYDPVPWRGLGRPQRVPVNAPDQVPDIDLQQYACRQKFRWDSNPQME